MITKWVFEISIYKQKGIYAIHNKVKDEYYIGCTYNNFGDRRDVHFAMLKFNKHHNKSLQSEYNLYGKDIFEFLLLEIMDSDIPEDYYEKETEYISIYRKIGKCINETDGGIGAKGTRLTKERISRLSEINRKNMQGKKLSDETREKMSLSRERNKDRIIPHSSGQILTEEDVYNIKIRLMNGESCRSIADEYKLTVQCISKINVGANWKRIVPDGWEEYLANRLK